MGYVITCKVLADEGQVFSELDAEDWVIAAGEGNGGLARATPDLGYPPLRRYPGERDHVVEEFPG